MNRIVIKIKDINVSFFLFLFFIYLFKEENNDYVPVGYTGTT